MVLKKIKILKRKSMFIDKNNLGIKIRIFFHKN